MPLGKTHDHRSLGDTTWRVQTRPSKQQASQASKHEANKPRSKHEASTNLEEACMLDDISPHRTWDIDAVLAHSDTDKDTPTLTLDATLNTPTSL